jgi:hypothetical protein
MTLGGSDTDSVLRYHSGAMSDSTFSDGDILYVPHRERVATTNTWAFLHWLRLTRGINLAGWAELQHFSVATPEDFGDALTRFTGLPEEPMRLPRHAGAHDALVFRRSDAGRLVFSRDALLSRCADLPDPIAAPLARRWPQALLVRPLAELLLFADLRPDDRVLVAGGATWPWLMALTLGTTVILAPATPLLAAVAEEGATVLIAPGTTLAGTAFRRAGTRPDLVGLRTIVATGGPMSPPERVRIYTWIKPDLMLLARSGGTVWGNPIEPISPRPKAAPALGVRPSPRVSARR